MIFSAIFGEFPPLYATKKSTTQPSPSSVTTSPSISSNPSMYSPKNAASMIYPSTSTQNKHLTSPPLTSNLLSNNNNNNDNKNDYYYTSAIVNKNTAMIAQSNNLANRNSFPGDVASSSAYKPSVSPSHQPPVVNDNYNPKYDPTINQIPNNMVRDTKVLDHLLTEKLKAVLEPRIISLIGELTEKEKMKAGLKEKSTNFMKANQDLNNKVENARRKVDTAERILNNYNQQLENAKMQPINPEDLIAPKNPPSEQGLEVLAEIDALEDTISQLGEAFKKKIVPLDQYMSSVRNMAREIFQLKVLLRKIFARKQEYLTTIEKLRQNASL